MLFTRLVFAVKYTDGGYSSGGAKVFSMTWPDYGVRSCLMVSCFVQAAGDDREVPEGIHSKS